MAEVTLTLFQHQLLVAVYGDEFVAHFRMSRTTAEMLTREVLRTGKILAGASLIDKKRRFSVARVALNRKMSEIIPAKKIMFAVGV